MKQFKTILEEVTVDCKDDGEQFTVCDRIGNIRKLLADSPYQLQKEGRLSLIYSKGPLEDKDVILISSHIDCVYEKCFVETGEEYYKGTLDNSITNAAVIRDMLNDRFREEVVVAFTGDEEQDSGGAFEVMSALEAAGARIHFVAVTDVTSQGWDNDCPFTIENDFNIDMLTAHSMIGLLLEKWDFSFVHSAEPDESWDYDEDRLPCLTLCVPAKGELHGEEGVLVRKKYMEDYCNALAFITDSL